MIRRQTVQKELVLDAVRTLHTHSTADEVYEFINKTHPSVGKGTVYRNLAVLAEEGQVLRVQVSDGPDRYDFTTEEHYHVKCVCCGSISDVNLAPLPNLIDKIEDKGATQFLGYEILFRGICSDCLKKQNDD